MATGRPAKFIVSGQLGLGPAGSVWQRRRLIEALKPQMVVKLNRFAPKMNFLIKIIVSHRSRSSSLNRKRDERNEKPPSLAGRPAVETVSNFEYERPAGRSRLMIEIADLNGF